MKLKNINKNFFYNLKLMILCTGLFLTFHAYSMVSDIDDEFDFLIANIDKNDLAKLRSCEPGEAAKWNSFLDVAEIPSLFNQQFYLYTSIPRSRNLINYPNWQLCSYQDMDSINQFTFHIFYNQTSKKNYTETTDKSDGTRIGSYINIENKTFLSLLDAGASSSFLPPELAPIKNLNFPLIFKNLANAKLEERRVGGIFHWNHQMNPHTYLELKTPLLWIIKNLNFTDEEKNLFRQQFAAFQGSDFDENEFAKQHIIFDSLGTGTTELSLSTKFLERETWSLDGGFFILLPTDFAFKRGLYGTYIEPKDQQPILHLCDLVVLGDGTNPQKSSNFNDILENYFFSALDHLASALLPCSLGYDKHLGFGLKLSPYWKVNDDLEFNSLYTVELLLPHEQKRFFAYKDKSKFSDEFAKLPSSNDAENNAKLLVLEERLTELLFPRVFTVKVFPGFIFTSASNLQQSYKNWNFTVGYSSWFQMDEKYIEITAADKHDFDKILDLNKSITQDAYMIKLYGKIHRLIHTNHHHEISFSFWADACVLNNTVGNDFTVGISFDTKF